MKARLSSFGISGLRPRYSKPALPGAGYQGEVAVKLKLKLIYDRQLVGPVCLGVGIPSGSHVQIIFSVWRLQVSWYGALSLTRGRVFNLLYNCFWALPEQSHLGWSSAELATILYCLIWDSPNLEGQVPVFVSSRNRVAQLYPRALGSLLSPLTTRRDYVGSILTRLRTGLAIKYYWQLPV
jgi:hypothetical protein